MNRVISVCLFCLALWPTGALSQPISASTAKRPRVFQLDAANLESIEAKGHSDLKAEAIIKATIEAADKAMHEGPFSVMQKAVTPPSGDKHDYMSQAPYFWADPSKPNGLPYIRRDGERNPELKRISDHDNLGRLGEDARILGLAYYFTSKPEYAARAALLLRTWFLDPATRMNPNLEFGQGIPGINTGRGIGLIETRSIISALDGVGLIAGSSSWSNADQHAMEEWIGDFLHWMRTSSKGRDEDAAKNNHGTWYDLQVTDYALFLGDRQLAVDTLERVKSRRIALQIEPDGREPLELARTNAWGYSIGNLDGLMQLADMGRHVGVDLWNYKTADGRSIRAALDFLLPYAEGKKLWDYQQIGGFHAGALLHPLQRAEKAYRDPRYSAAAAKLSVGKNDVETLLLSYRNAVP